MCTLIIGRDVFGSGTLIAGANRDEDPERPSTAPGALTESPRVVGGRDRVAGGTWLAVRERRAVIAMLNRHERDAAPRGPVRSRGLLALDVAGVTEHDRGGLAGPALGRALEAFRTDRYAPFSLVFLSIHACWVLEQSTQGAVVRPIPRGWHVLTHTELDDFGEPRARRLLDELRSWSPASPSEAERGVAERLRQHGVLEPGQQGYLPPVCIHEGRMITVSSSIVSLSADRARYLHAEGPPCTHALTDLSHLLEPGVQSQE